MTVKYMYGEHTKTIRQVKRVVSREERNFVASDQSYHYRTHTAFVMPEEITKQYIYFPCVKTKASDQVLQSRKNGSSQQLNRTLDHKSWQEIVITLFLMSNNSRNKSELVSEARLLSGR